MDNVLYTERVRVAREPDGTIYGAWDPQTGRRLPVARGLVKHRGRWLRLPAGAVEFHWPVPREQRHAALLAVGERDVA